MNPEALEEAVYNLILDKVARCCPDKSPDEISAIVRGTIIRNLWENKIRESREEISNVGRLLYKKDFLPGTSGNISVRIGENALLITPSGINKGILKPQDLLLIDLEGNNLDPDSYGKPSSETKMHLIAYKKRKDVGAIVHTHPPFSTAFASSRSPLDVKVLPEVIVVLGNIQMVDYATPSTYEVPEKLEPHLQNNNAFLLCNHGAMTFGRNLKEASHRMETLEFFARVLLLARLLGGEKLLDKSDIEKLKKAFGII